MGYGEQEGIKGCILNDRIKRKYFTSWHISFNEEKILPLTKPVTNYRESSNKNEKSNKFVPYEGSKQSTHTDINININIANLHSMH